MHVIRQARRYSLRSAAPFCTLGKLCRNGSNPNETVLTLTLTLNLPLMVRNRSGNRNMRPVHRLVLYSGVSLRYLTGCSIGLRDKHLLKERDIVGSNLGGGEIIICQKIKAAAASQSAGQSCCRPAAENAKRQNRILDIMQNVKKVTENIMSLLY